MVKIYRSKERVEAIRWLWKNWSEITDFVPVPDVLYVPKEEKDKGYPTLKIRTLFDDVVVKYGDYIIKQRGKYFACAKEDFEGAYEEIN